MRRCHYCKSSDADLRPYGPNGADLCFGCMTSSPDREVEAKRRFAGQLVGAGPVAVLDAVNEVGPRPPLSGELDAGGEQ